MAAKKSSTKSAPKSNIPEHPYEVGKSYLFRGVTMYQVGTVKAVYESEIVIEPAAWIPDTGRFNEALKNGVLSEVEPYAGAAIIARSALMDVWPWNHGVPVEVK